MLFNLAEDPHEQVNLTKGNPNLVETGKQILRDWKAEQQSKHRDKPDPLETTLAEGGSLHGREGWWDNYPKRLRETGRAEIADRLEAKYATLSTSTDV